ncbi:MAG: phosphoadenosine phosphosulfate reductase family protein, partial [Chloroflexi bacterium]|nr:phosphoadenosine phosphosulfate reductase family protein [Chloroflexota bacterium]
MEETEKIEHAKELIAEAIRKYPRIAVACSFGKDSMVTVHIAREVDPDIKIFSVMTQFKPRETFTYLKKMNKKMNLKTTVYMVADSVPKILRDASLEVILLPVEEFNRKASQVESYSGRKIYELDP